MKVICITGATPSDLHKIAGIFMASGMAPARSLQHPTGFDMAALHGRLLDNSSATTREALHPLPPPGRLWEQLAGDLFLANLDAPLWGWHEADSALLLDFWHDFEPHIHFVLTSVPPRQALVRSLAEAGGDPADALAILATWRQRHEAMLRFALRHPGRSLLVAADDCLARPARLLEVCAKRWGTPLSPPPALDAAPPAADDPLSLYLADRLCDAWPELSALAQEIEAAQARLEPDPEPAQQSQIGPDGLPDDVFAAFRRYLDLMRQVRAPAPANPDDEPERAWQAEEALSEPVPDRQHEEALARQLEIEQARLNDARLENELVRMQLREVQGELERYFKQYHETLEEQSAVRARLGRLLARHPELCDCDGLEVQPLAEAGEDALAWELHDLCAGGRQTPHMAFVTVVHGGVAGFVFDRASDGTSPLVRWPAVAADIDRLLLHPGGPGLDALAASDWHLLGALARILPAALAAPGGALPEDFPRAAVAEAFGRLGQGLAAYPPALRYDGVQLKREQINPDYEHLWIALDGLDLCGQRWPQFEFRLSCAGIAPGRFGLYPKLEFPQKPGQGVLDSWFAESCDDFGDKLELRFALPDGLDSGVWQRLSARDQYLLAALCDRLPFILADLRLAGVRPDRAFDDWEQLAGHVRRILVGQVVAAGSS
ncbi:hypothetical protein [Solidesulfovibrio sp.]